MPAATTHGFPYPAGGDKMADTDIRVKELADFLEAKWGAPISPPRCELVASAATPLATAYTKIALATTVANNATHFTVASSVITVLAAGQYDISAWAGCNTNIAQFFAISKNGTAIHPAEFGTNIAGSFYAPLGVLQLPLAANDTIQLVGAVGSGTPSTVHTANNFSRLLIRRVGT